MKESIDLLVISDLHIGMKDSKVAYLNKFLKKHTIKKIHLNGDIFDSFVLRRNNSLEDEYVKFVRILLKKMLKENTEIIYIRGNHDDFLYHLIKMRLSFPQLKFLERADIVVDDKKYLILHGDVFDKHIPFIMYRLGSWAYDFLLFVNRVYNRARTKNGKEYYSISQQIKLKTKGVLAFLQRFEKNLVGLAKNEGYDGVICGHIHNPVNKMIDGIHYLNSGDLLENTTVLVKNDGDEWKIVDVTRN